MESKKLEKPCEKATFQALQREMKPDEETGGGLPTMKSIGGQDGRKEEKKAPAEASAAPAEAIDFSKVKIEPLFEEMVDFETFSKSDFGAVKVKDCAAVP